MKWQHAGCHERDSKAWEKKKEQKSSQILTNLDTYFTSEFQLSVSFSFCDQVSRDQQRS